MIFLDKHMTDTKIGKCPICDREAEVIDSCKEIEESYDVVHRNAFYVHYKGVVDYVRKIRKPKTIWS